MLIVHDGTDHKTLLVRIKRRHVCSRTSLVLFVVGLSILHSYYPKLDISKLSQLGPRLNPVVVVKQLLLGSGLRTVRSKYFVDILKCPAQKL